MSRNQIFLIVLVTIVVGLLTALFWDYTQDDVFITYVYSRNLAEGRGFVFNPGERVQGTTTPLYTILMAGAYLLTSDMLHAGNLLSAIFLVMTVAVTIHFSRNILSIYGQAAFALTVAVSPLIYVSFGMETLLYCLVLMSGFWCWHHNRDQTAIVMASLLTWIRADGVLMAVTFGLLALWRQRRLPWKLAMLYTVLTAPWFLFAFVYFGSPLPQTLGAKEAVLTGIGFINGQAGGLHWWREFYGVNNPLAVLAFPAATAGLLLAFSLPRLRALSLWAMLYTLGYTILNVSAFWYFTPLFVVLVWLAAFGAEYIVRQLLNLGFHRRLAITGAVVLLSVFTGLAVVRALDFGEPPPRVETYTIAGQWINHHTKHDGKLMVGDLGIIGFHAHRHTLDTPGLITPRLQYLNHDSYAVASVKPDMVFAPQYPGWQQVFSAAWFNNLYRPVASFSSQDDPFSPMYLFERRVPATVPDSVYQGDSLALPCTYTLSEDEPVPERTTALLRDTDGTIVRELTRPFAGGVYPDHTAPSDDEVLDLLIIPADLAPGLYTWETSCGESGVISIQPIIENPAFVALDNPARWPDFVQMLGYVLHAPETWSGGELTLTVVWEVLAPTADDYSVFVHVVDSSGTIVAQGDGYPRFNTVYTSQWKVGSVIFDERRVRLPDDMASGPYRVRLGWYDWHTGARFDLQNGLDVIDLPVTIRNRFPGGSGRP